MRRTGKGLAVVVAVAVVLFLGFSFLDSGRRPGYGKGTQPEVRVRITRFDGARSIVVSVDSPFTVSSLSGWILARARGARNLVASPAEGGIRLGRRSFTGNGIEIRPSNDGTVRLDDVRFRGAIRILDRGKGRLWLVNRLPMEDYIAGVVGCEMPLSWPLAALQVQAVAARTYALHELQNARRSDFDVYDTVRSQVYRGRLRETPAARRAVRSTAGMVLTYMGRPFKAFFHSTCGGHTASAAQVFGGTSAIAPLSGRACGYCGHSKYHRWSTRITRTRLRAALRKLRVDPDGTIVAIDVADKDPGGRGLRVRIRTKRKVYTLGAAQLRRVLGYGREGLLSTAFTVRVLPEAFEFSGRGWGHGVGMCQMGVHGQTTKGFDARSILQFYYPGAAILRLWR